MLLLLTWRWNDAPVGGCWPTSDPPTPTWTALKQEGGVDGGEGWGSACGSSLVPLGHLTAERAVTSTLLSSISALSSSTPPPPGMPRLTSVLAASQPPNKPTQQSALDWQLLGKVRESGISVEEVAEEKASPSSLEVWLELPASEHPEVCLVKG